MLENFQLATIIKQGTQTSLLQIPLYQGLQENLADNWQAQYNTFIDDIREIDFQLRLQIRGRRVLSLV